MSEEKAVEIKGEGYTITEVPGVDAINVRQDPIADYGVSVTIKLAPFDVPLGYGLDELDELVEALQRASVLAHRMASEIAPEEH